MVIEASEDMIKYAKDYAKKWPTGFCTQYLTLMER